jgi:hypothetical protein
MMPRAAALLTNAPRVVLLMAEPIMAADVALLDNRVCCYPDAGASIGSAFQKSRRDLALT